MEKSKIENAEALSKIGEAMSNIKPGGTFTDSMREDYNTKLNQARENKGKEAEKRYHELRGLRHTDRAARRKVLKETGIKLIKEK